MRIGELIAIENKKFLEEKERKLKKDIENLKTKHDLEFVSFHMKMTAVVNEFKKSRTIEYERLMQKFKNKFKDLEKLQNTELNLLLRNSNLIYIFFIILTFIYIYNIIY
jgi:hypothetical protein